MNEPWALGMGAIPRDPISPVLAAVKEQLPAPCLVERPPQTPSPCGGGVDPAWSPQLLLYSSTQELKTLATLKLRVAMLDQQIHLEKVLSEHEVAVCNWAPMEPVTMWRAAAGAT